MDELDYSLLTKAGAESKTFSAGDVIFSDGDKGNYLYVVRSGAVDIERHGTVIATVKPGGIFGEMALIDGSPRSATARAKDTCELTAVTERSFLYLVHDTPYFALDVMRSLAERLRAMNELI